MHKKENSNSMEMVQETMEDKPVRTVTVNVGDDPTKEDAKSVDDVSADDVNNAVENAALSEPNALPIVLGDTASTAVSQTRKEQLLLQARLDRRRWVQSVPLPFESRRDPNNVWTLDDRLSRIQSTPACTRLPAVTKVLSELYGMEDQSRTPEYMADRIESLIGPVVKGDDEHLIGGSSQSFLTAAGDDPAILKAYQEFWSTLLQPECALLVQGMRNFLRNLEGASMERMATSLKSYLETTYESLKSQVAWKNRVDENVRRSLESFMYGQGRPLLDKLEWTGLFSMTHVEWMERISQLQFVEASHLEIACLEAESQTVVDELLATSMESLLSVDRYFSPYEKLQRILAVYQGVNAALSSALNKQRQSDDKSRKLPSADDVLPTIILVVLRAKPERMLRNLQLVEVFCPPEYLRGEAGYAYTNLYGAVQFLQDLDMDEPSSLSISPEDFKKGLEQSRQSAEKRRSGLSERIQQSEITQSIDIRVQDVRSARLRGEKVDLDWAVKWQEKNTPEIFTGTQNSIDDTTPEASLPDGFTRSYTFLGTRPEHVRLSDLPQLLDEYRMLVHATEHLLMERANRLESEKRRKKHQQQEVIRGTVLQVEVETSEEAGLEKDGGQEPRARSETS